MRRSLYWSRALLILLALLAVVGCSPGQDGSQVEGAARGSIEGIVYYRERMLLPPGAELEVHLQDISQPDALPNVIATVLLALDGSPPYEFAIEYDAARIDRHARHALRATIAVGDELMFASTGYIDPFGDSPLEVLVQRVPEPVRRDTF